MPLNPSIIMGVQRPQPVDPMESYGKSLALKGLIGQQELQGLQMQQARQGLEDEANVRDAYKQSAGNMDTLRRLLGERGSYKQIQALDKLQLEQEEKRSTIDKNKAAAGKDNAEVALKEAERAASMLSVAKADPTAYPAIRRLAELQFPNLAKRLPAEYDPNVIESELAAGMTYVQRLTDQRKAQELAETGRHNRTTEANTVRGQDLTAQTAREGHAVTRRGQDLTNARAIEANAAGGRTYDAERGIVVNTRDNTAAPVVQGGAAIGPKDKPLTESQGNATGFGMRALRANETLARLEKDGTDVSGTIKQGAESVPIIGGMLGQGVNALPSFLGGPSSQQQQVEQAQRDFINAVLRKESGANINESEFQNARLQYFPQRGDSPAVREQKRKNRESAIEALKIQAGPGASSIKPAPDTSTTTNGQWSVVR